MINFKLAIEEDIPSILAMRKLFYAIDGYPFEENVQKSITTHFIQNQSLGQLWLLLENNITIGYMAVTFWYSFERGGHTAFIDELFVSTGHRGKGIGTSALVFIQRALKLKGYTSICLEVEPKNNIAKSLYVKEGFSDINRNLYLKYL